MNNMAHYLESAAGMWNLLASVSNEAAPPTGGKCGDEDPELFFPITTDPRNAQVRKAKAVCASCPVLAECRVYGMTQRDGIWGGMTESERRELRSQGKKRKKTVAELLAEIAASETTQQVASVAQTPPVSPRVITPVSAKQSRIELDGPEWVEHYIATTADLFAKGA